MNYNVLCAMLFFILLSIISVNHQNMNIFWQNYLFSAYYRLILQNLAESFSRLSKVSRKKNIFSTYDYNPHHNPIYHNKKLNGSWVWHENDFAKHPTPRLVLTYFFQNIFYIVCFHLVVDLVDLGVWVQDFKCFDWEKKQSGLSEAVDLVDNHEIGKRMKDIKSFQKKINCIRFHQQLTWLTL